MAYISCINNTKDLSITIYNDNFGVVKEKRTMDLPQGEDKVQYLDVAQLIETDSILIEGLEVIELNYDYDLVSREKLLEKYLDKTVFLYDREKNLKVEYRLLSVCGGVVLENISTREIVMNPKEELILPKLPDNLIIKPALIWKIKPAEVDEIKVSYLTKGLAWSANYVVELKEKDFNIAGWVNIENHSGTSYDNTRLKLIAGDVKRIDKGGYHDESDRMVVYECSSEASPNFKEQSFFDYHMYTLQGETTLKNNQSKQINFINASDVAYRKYYEMNYRSDKPRVIIEFDNSAGNNLGVPLPKGFVKVYKEDVSDHSLEFIGEDSIDHTPKEEIVKVYIGDAFDVRCEGYRAEYKKNDGFEVEEYEYLLSNHKDEEIEVRLSHYIRGCWEMEGTSDDYSKITSNEIQFRVKVKDGEEKVIRFKYRIDNRVTIEIK